MGDGLTGRVGSLSWAPTPPLSLVSPPGLVHKVGSVLVRPPVAQLAPSDFMNS